MIRKSILCFFSFLAFATMLEGQPKLSSPKFIGINKTETPILLDGKLDDEVWKQASASSDFHQFFPFDTSRAEMQTEVKMLFDDENIYVGVYMEDKTMGEFVSLSLRRDFQGNNADGFTLVLDPFQDKTNAFFFGVNPYNVQREGLIFNGGNAAEEFDLSWDNIWYSATHIGDGFWSLEMVIPFKSIRYNASKKAWNINFYRFDSKKNEQSVWSRVPRQFVIFNLAFSGELIWSENPKKQGANIAVIPFAATNINENRLEEIPANGGVSIGTDVKIGLTPGLNLDITTNPDFSQVEVDQQQTNIDRFEIFFPERRQFFLENADLFSNFGFENARPFFSRRIGVAIDSTTGQNVENRILAGARVSGKVNDDWRVGLMNMQTETNPLVNVQGSNFTVAAVQRKVFNRSNISGLFVNQQSPEGTLVDVFNPGMENYNRLAGIEYNLASADGKWTGKSYYQKTFDAGPSEGSFAHGTLVSYNTLNFFASWTHQIIGENFRANVGFVPRTDFNRVNPQIGFNIFPKSKLVNAHTFILSNNTLWNDTWGITDNNLAGTWLVTLQNTSMFNLSLLSNYVKLFFPFNPTGNPDQQFQAGESFQQDGLLINYQSDMRKPFSVFSQVISGGFFNGNLRQFAGNINYRYHQYANFALAYTINRINLSDGFDDATILLIGPRLDLTFTNSLFFTTFLQYNTQFDNININSRLQWRFRPVSDLFIVYTENYFPTDFLNKNRALVAKLTYWLNF